MSCADFVGMMFLARDVAHSAHLNTRSYAKHMALNTFYGEIIDLADGLAEAYQGRHGLMDEIPYFTPALGKKTIAATATELEKHMDKVQELRYEACPKTETAIQNLIDEAVSAYQTALYKLRFLQ